MGIVWWILYYDLHLLLVGSSFKGIYLSHLFVNNPWNIIICNDSNESLSRFCNILGDFLNLLPQILFTNNFFILVVSDTPLNTDCQEARLFSFFVNNLSILVIFKATRLKKFFDLDFAKFWKHLRSFNGIFHDIVVDYVRHLIPKYIFHNVPTYRKTHCFSLCNSIVQTNLIILKSFLAKSLADLFYDWDRSIYFRSNFYTAFRYDEEGIRIIILLKDNLAILIF